MDTVNMVVQIIQSVGFPIVCCGALFWYMIKQRDVHREETDKLAQALNNNTQAIIELKDKLGGINKNDV